MKPSACADLKKQTKHDLIQVIAALEIECDNSAGLLRTSEQKRLAAEEQKRDAQATLVEKTTAIRQAVETFAAISCPNLYQKRAIGQTYYLNDDRPTVHLDSHERFIEHLLTLITD